MTAVGLGSETDSGRSSQACPASRADTPATRFTATVRSEWTKIFSLRFPRSLGLIAVLLAPLAAALFLLTVGATQSTSLPELSVQDIVGTALLGVDATTIVLIIVGAWSAGGEYASGMIRTTLVATPARATLFAAKTLCTAVVAVMLGLLAALGAMGAAQLVLAAYGLPVLDLTDAHMLRMTLGSALMVPFYAVVATTSAFLVRSTGGAVTCALVVMAVPALVNMLPDTVRHTLLPVFPGPGLHSISGTATPADAEYLMPAAAAISLVCWVAAFLVAGVAVFSRRDA